MPNLIDEAGVKFAATVGGFKAAVHGLRGVFRTLSQEHSQLAVLIRRALATSDLARRAELWATLRVELVAHERAEINHVYPEGAIHPSLARLDERHEAEADELEAILSELDVLASDAERSVDSAQWQGTLEHLQKLVLHHTRREEEDYFPQLQDAIGDERSQELEGVYLRAKMAIIHDFD